MNNNPSPGNKAGGLTTILEKSLGAVAKGGTTNLVDVYEYAEPVTAKGFVYMDTPGLRPGVGHRPGRRRRQHDLLHHRPRLGLRLQAGAVAQARHQHRRSSCTQEEDMDINCGTIVDGERDDRSRWASAIFELILETASGKQSKSEELGYGDDEFAPWMLGATM